MAKQTCLEKQGINARHDQTVRSDYNIDNAYSVTHPDAVSNGDAQGKGTESGGHTHWLPSCDGTPNNKINYSNFDSFNGGGVYDIKGRNGIGGRERAMATSLYNQENEYGPTSVDTTANVNDGQYFVGQQIGQKTA